MTDSTMPTSDLLQIGPARADSLTEVFSLVFGHYPPQDALSRVRTAMAEYRAGRISGAGLLAARRAGRLVGAVLVQILPGRSATFWPARLVAGEENETAEKLASRAMAHVRENGVCVVHTLLDGQPDASDVDRLERAGFAKLAELYYLLAEEHDFPARAPEGALTLETCTAGKLPRLCSVVEATYEATLDCPGLDGIRSAAEVLEGYGASTENCPPHWFFVCHEGRDVGCLLMTDYAEHGNCELTYMGLAPATRGRGWGLLVARHAQWIARSLGRSRIVLAVDSINWPARNMYASAGFRGWDRRHVYMLALEP